MPGDVASTASTQEDSMIDGKRAKRYKVDTGKCQQHNDDEHFTNSATMLVVVTGGSKGIGKACIDSFARHGARVLFSYCSDAASAARIELAYQPPGRVQGRHLDQGDFQNVRAFAAEVDRWRNGRQLDTLINNAALGTATVSNYRGLQPVGSDLAANVVDEAWRRAEEDMVMMRVNALGPMWVTEALLPMMMMRQTRGKPETGDSANTADTEAFGGKQTVLFIGSVGGGSQSVFPGFRAADGMSKAALAYACKHFAARRRDHHHSAIRKNTATEGMSAEKSGSADTDEGDRPTSSAVDFLCLCPGATLTDMFKASTLDNLNGAEERERFVRAMPQGRLIRPEEVGEAVYWLCSCPSASMFHGAVIDASAGLAVRPGAITEYSF